jgi:D-alanyl-lipoteichoic acid acyltransferase DltB (MBOAT superfamily)
MLFNSFHFLVFFPVVTAIYFFLPHRARWGLLLIASCYFYMVFKPEYILILAFTILVDYYAGQWIADAVGRRRRWFLILSIIANVGILAFFKYYNFLNDTLTSVLGWAGAANPIPAIDILLPIGLSFHIFQSLSYTIEVYRGHQEPERHFGYYALYVMFYPQLVAGPIERPQNILHQLHTPHALEYDRVVAGLQLMAWGFFKKVVIADRLSAFVAGPYASPELYPGISLSLATIAFAFQIYCDFSGYSDIAIGAAQVMGIRLMTNFRQPYFSRSIAEFWKRWHISLSTWFRDYVYISMGGNRVAPPRWFFNLFITFLVSGLWHGAAWTFVIWGGLNGIYLIVGVLKDKWLASRRPQGSAVQPGFLARWRAVLLTFTLTCIAWVFFRAESLSDALLILRRLPVGLAELPTQLGDRGFIRQYIMLGQGREDVLVAAAALAVLFVVELWQQREPVRQKVATWPPVARYALYYAAVVGILLFGAFNQSQSFIYFQF